jgi:hypothetical protein
VAATCLDVRVTIAVGLFELFTYAIPGSLYVALFSYIAGRAQWIDIGAVSRAPVLLLAIGIVLLSYLLGYLAYPVGHLADKIVPRRRMRDARAEFVTRVPVAKDREFVRADPFVLLAGLQLHNREVATDVSQLRAAGLMLRNCAPPMLFGAIAAFVEIFIGRSLAFAISSTVILLTGHFALIVQSRRLSHWARMRTLEVGFWLPEVDDKFRTMES